MNTPSTDQDNCSDGLILVPMTPTLGPYEVLFGSEWISSWLQNSSRIVFRYCNLRLCLMQFIVRPRFLACAGSVV